MKTVYCQLKIFCDFKRCFATCAHSLWLLYCVKAWHKMGDNKGSLDFGRIERLNKILRVFVAMYLNMGRWVTNRFGIFELFRERGKTDKQPLEFESQGKKSNLLLIKTVD